MNLTLQNIVPKIVWNPPKNAKHMHNQGYDKIHSLSDLCNHSTRKKDFLKNHYLHLFIIELEFNVS